MDSAGNTDIYLVFVKLLDGHHKAFYFSTPTIAASTLKSRIETLTSIPYELQYIIKNSRIIDDHQTIDLSQDYPRKVQKTLTDDPNSEQLQSPGGPNSSDDSVRESSYWDDFQPLFLELSIRLRAGKGGFGSLLRGAATKAGQNKTSNFDACRDMSGRRLRHVNAEKKLEEWRAEAEERKLEKMAEDFIKKKVKEAVKNGKSSSGNSGVEKYVEKYRKDSAKCMEEVERAVREAVKGSKRERGGDGVEKSESDSKRLKIWMGKRKLGESDTEDDSDEEKEEGDEKSVVIDNGNQSDSGKESERSQDSTTDGKVDAESICLVSSGSGSDEEGTSGPDSLKGERNGLISELIEEKLDNNGFEAKIAHESHFTDNKMVDHPTSPSESKVSDATITVQVQEKSQSDGVEAKELDKPLNFDDIHSVTELEVLGMERLKTELQARGLKCGGTLPERAARLFLLKTTPLEKLPKKLFAKK